MEGQDMRRPLHWDDPDDFKRMRDVFVNADFSPDGIRARVGLEHAPGRHATVREIWDSRTRDDGALATLMRVFLMAVPVDAERFRRAIAPMTVEGWVRAGLVTVDGATVRPAVHVNTYGSLLLAYDIANSDIVPMTADYVMGIGAASRTLANA